MEQEDTKTYTGNFDFANRPGWTLIGGTCMDGLDWKIHGYRIQTGLVVRVTACGEAPCKANYKIKWDGSNIVGVDASVLKTHRPALYDEVLRALAEVKTTNEAKQPSGRSFKATLGYKYHVKHDLGLLEGACWLLAKRAGPNKGNWDMFKLVADRPVPNKAGYYLEWNGTRLAKSRDAKLLIDHRPELYERVVSALSGGKQQEQEDLWGEFIDTI